MLQPDSQHSFVGLGPRYGASVLKAPSNFAHGQRRRMNALAIGLNVFLPWLLFCAVFGVISFNVKIGSYPQVALTPFVLVLGVVAVVITAGLAIKYKRTRVHGWTEGEPTWLMFASVAMALALVLGFVFGDMNYFYNYQAYGDESSLNTFEKVNPAKDKGEALMDAGRVYFTEGTKLDFQKAMSFRNGNLYCVAPIVLGNDTLASYDFWAAGVDCCAGGDASDFRCGEFNNPNARAGLRLMKDEDRPFFRLAVQQAESAYYIEAAHPLFFQWVQDPVSQVDSYRDHCFMYFLLGICSHFVFNSFCVACAVLGFSKIGRFYGPDQH